MRLILRFVSCCHHPYQPGGGWNDIILGEALSIFQENLAYLFSGTFTVQWPKIRWSTCFSASPVPPSLRRVSQRQNWYCHWKWRSLDHGNVEALTDWTEYIDDNSVKMLFEDDEEFVNSWNLKRFGMPKQMRTRWRTLLRVWQKNH